MPKLTTTKKLSVRTDIHPTLINGEKAINSCKQQIKFKISDDQTNIDKYRITANITEYHIISKLILQQIIITNF